jgi:hypothetical protein
MTVHQPVLHFQVPFFVYRRVNWTAVVGLGRAIGLWHAIIVVAGASRLSLVAVESLSGIMTPIGRNKFLGQIADHQVFAASCRLD